MITKEYIAATDIVERLCLKCQNRVKTTGAIACRHYGIIMDEIKEACGYVGKARPNKIVSIDTSIFDVTYNKNYVSCHKFVQKKKAITLCQ